MLNNNSIKKRDQILDFEPAYMPEAEMSVPDDYYGAAQVGGEKQQIYKVLNILRKYWLMILGITLLITGLVVVYEAQKPDYYKSEVRIQVNNETNPGATSVVVNQGNDYAYFATQLQILEGSGLLRRVVKTLDLENNQSFIKPAQEADKSVWRNVLRMFGFAKTETAKGSEKLVAADNTKLELKDDSAVNLDKQAETLAPYVNSIKRSLSVSPVEDTRTLTKATRLIEVEYNHQDPAIATKMVNTIADLYVLQNLEQKVETNAAAGDFLQKRVAELQSQIREGEERLINYAKSNQIISLDSTQNTVVQRLSDLNTKLSQAESDRITAEAAYRSAVQNPLRTKSAETKDARTSALEVQLTQLKQQLALLKTEYTEEWGEVRKVRKQIEEIEQQLSTNRVRASDTELAGLEQTYRETAAREKELRGNFNAQRNAVLTQNEAAINYRIIQQEIDTNKSLLDNLLQRSRETEVILNGTPNNVHIVDRALVPRSPAGPNRFRNVIGAFFASLFCGVGLAFLLSWMDDSIKSSDNLETMIGIPVIGMIPESPTGFFKRIMPSSLKRKKRFKRGVNQYSNVDFEKPIISEAFHQLRTSLLLSTAGGAPRNILVTSAEPSEGKTVTSMNLARSLSQLGGKVLLMDADLRCPKMHFIHNISNVKGLSNLLTASELDQNMIDNMIHKDLHPNLDILTSGPHAPNPANLFSSLEMKKLLEQLSVTYSHIIIDSPPVLYFADSLILASGVDAVILITRENISSQSVLMQAKRKLYDVRANVVGLVVNDIPISNYQYNNYNYYKQLELPEAEDGGMLLNLDK